MSSTIYMRRREKGPVGASGKYDVTPLPTAHVAVDCGSFHKSRNNLVLTVLALVCLAVSTSASHAQGCIAPPSGLVNWWPVNSNVVDYVTGSSGILFNGASFVPAEVADGLNFDGVSQSASFGNKAGNFGTNDFTIEFWIRSASTQGQAVLSKRGGCAHSSFFDIRMGVNGVPGALLIELDSDASGQDYSSLLTTGSVNDGNFHHVAFIRQATNITAYIDGVVDSSTNTPRVVNLTNSIDVMAGNGPCVGTFVTHLFTGILDEISFYNRALSNSEISSLANSGAQGKCLPPILFTAQPVSQIVRAASTVTFNVSGLGQDSLSYQWQFNGAPLPGATNTSLVLTNVDQASVGTYSAILSNSFTTLASSNAALKVIGVGVLVTNVSLTNAQYFFSNAVTVTLQNYYPNGVIFYTLDGTDPSFNSPIYNGPFLVSNSVTVKALGYGADFSNYALSSPVTINIVPFYNIVATPVGPGTISASPAAASYPSGSLVSVTAVPSNGWSFLQWLGDDGGINPTVSLVMDRNKKLLAIFGTFLSSTAAGGGSVVMNPAGGRYPYGTKVRLTAVPQTGYYFVLWGNAASGNANPLTFTVTNASKSVSSLFGSLSSGQAAMTILSSGSGAVSMNPPGNVFSTGSTVVITATPDAGQKFLGWSGDATGTQNPLVVNLTQSKIITGNFTQNPILKIAVSATSNKVDRAAINLSGPFGSRYSLDESSDLATWNSLAAITNWYGTNIYVDTISTNSAKAFYRATLLP